MKPQGVTAVPSKAASLAKLYAEIPSTQFLDADTHSGGLRARVRAQFQFNQHWLYEQAPTCVQYPANSCCSFPRSPSLRRVLLAFRSKRTLFCIQRLSRTLSFSVRTNRRSSH